MWWNGDPPQELVANSIVGENYRQNARVATAIADQPTDRIASNAWSSISNDSDFPKDIS